MSIHKTAASVPTLSSNIQKIKQVGHDGMRRSHLQSGYAARNPRIPRNVQTRGVVPRGKLCGTKNR